VHAHEFTAVYRANWPLLTLSMHKSETSTVQVIDSDTKNDKRLGYRWWTARQLHITLEQCWNWPKRTGGSDVEMFGILPRDWNLKPIFTQKWASVYMNWGGGSTPSPRQFQPRRLHTGGWANDLSAVGQIHRFEIFAFVTLKPGFMKSFKVLLEGSRGLSKNREAVICMA